MIDLSLNYIVSVHKVNILFK